MSATDTVIDPATKSMEDIVALCKRRGFVYPASEIYGGINGFWDYGPLGTALKNNIRDFWWKHTVECPPMGPDGEPVSIVGLDSSIIQNPKTWEASGHVGGFTDPRVDCKHCKARFRADHVFVVLHWTQDAVDQWRKRLDDAGDDSAASAIMQSDDPQAAAAEEIRLLQHGGANLPSPYVKTVVASGPEEAVLLGALTERERKSVAAVDATAIDYDFFYRERPPYIPITPPCPNCGHAELTEPRQFNLMFESETGAVSGETMTVYLRPETAQGIFLNYKNVLDTMRVKVPFGIAQIGKSFRNEVTPRNFIFRSREFEQMEMEFFCAPEDSPKWYEFWKQERMDWWKKLGIAESNLRFRDHDPDELAHYSKMCVDVEYKYPFTAPGFGELEGVAHRGCFDLTQHQEHSKQKLDYFDQELQVQLQKDGVDKDEIKQRSRYIPNVIEPASGLTRAVLVLLCEAYTPDETRPSKMFMKFDPKFAPIKAGIFPLVNKDGMPEVAQKLYMQLREKHTCQMDAKQSIGKRYARMDEAGTPYCFTIDGDTLSDQTVTVRDRDSQSQERINIDQVENFLADKL